MRRVSKNCPWKASVISSEQALLTLGLGRGEVSTLEGEDSGLETTFIVPEKFSLEILFVSSKSIVPKITFKDSGFVRFPDFPLIEISSKEDKL